MQLKMAESIYQDAIDHLSLLIDDIDASKMFKEKAKLAIGFLEAGADLAVEKALLQLEDLNNHDMSSYHRTQVWDVISLLESIKG
jgi:uncharacterized protein (UPF0147 family)